MTLFELKESFHEQLAQFYPKEEIDSFFFLVLDYFFQKSRIDFSLHPKWVIDPEEENKLNDILIRLKQQEPIQYVLGETTFFDLKFIVDENVLIPRPETEELVDFILKSEIFSKSTERSNILDIGTGSGCIAVTLAHHLKQSDVFATDVSYGALETAKINAENNRVKVQFSHHDILSEDDLRFHSQEKDLVSINFDVIVSNPPYVREKEKLEMHNNVINYEPHQALFVANDDALVYYEAITDFAVNNLKEKGWLFFEINQYLGTEMKTLLEKRGFADIELKKDLFGNDRMVKARLK